MQGRAEEFILDIISVSNAYPITTCHITEYLLSISISGVSRLYWVENPVMVSI